MTAYQVFSGETDKHGRQTYDLHATYLDRDRALEHCQCIVENDTLKDEKIEEYVSSDGSYRSWLAGGMEWVTICQLREITITE
jgi:hypothetical protein